MILKFYDKLYIGDKIEDKKNIIDNIEKGEVLGIYLICISKNINHIFDVFAYSELYSSIYKDKTYMVVGIAKGKKDAFLLVKKIFEDYISKGKDIKKIKQSFRR